MQARHFTLSPLARSVLSFFLSLRFKAEQRRQRQEEEEEEEEAVGGGGAETTGGAAEAGREPVCHIGMRARQRPGSDESASGSRYHGAPEII